MRKFISVMLSGSEASLVLLIGYEGEILRLRLRMTVAVLWEARRTQSKESSLGIFRLSVLRVSAVK